jgi:uncharacterized protein YkwD
MIEKLQTGIAAAIAWSLVGGALLVPGANATSTRRGSAPALPAVCAGANLVADAANVATVRAAVLCLVNAERAGAGRAALADNAQLAQAAQAHSADMVARSFFAHTTPDGVTFDVRIQRTGYAGWTMGENIAWGGGTLATAQSTVTMWIASPAHEANIVNADFAESGIGVALGTPTAGLAGATFTQDFGARR